MTIKVLESNIISKIAAGEVIERPASVVKELLENSLDAGATQINVEIRGGGVEFIKVADNGSGIPPQEIEIAFERHATSKLSDITDLDKITSLGFRGEALPSIASVSEITLVSRNDQELVGVSLSLKNGNVAQRANRGAPVGTTVTVRDLFGNIPARRKFLKSYNTESGHIVDLISSYSLAFKNVRFVLIVDGRNSLRTSGSGDLRQTVSEVYGLDLAKNMLEVGDISNQGTQINGLISPPSLHKSNREYINLFVNKRWIHSRLLSWAIEEAYHGMLPGGRHPVAVVNLTVNPQDIDVNVHPTKTEVRFRDEREVFAILQKSIRHSLVEQSPVPELKTLSATTVVPDIPSNPQPKTMVTRLWPQEKQSVLPLPAVTQTTPKLPLLRVLGQASNMYIIAEGPEGVYLIDQHAAHERIQFEKFISQRQAQKIEKQMLLEPLSIEINPKQEENLKFLKTGLLEFGFDLEYFGPRTYLVRSVPAILTSENISVAIKELLDCLEDTDISRREEKIAMTLACHASVRAGKVMSDEEMRQLILQLEKTNQPRTCPHGRPTMIHLSASQLEREFGRR